MPVRIHKSTPTPFFQLDRLKDDPNLLRIRPEKIFCNTYVPDRCVVEWNDRPLYRDVHHLNPAGVALLADKLAAAMKAKGWLDRGP